MLILKRAISIRQPYVELILTGEKTREYRSRSTAVRERVYLYAAKTLATVDGFDAREAFALPRGLIVGSVEITDCVWLKSYDQFGYHLKNPVRFETPLAVRGTPQPLFWYPIIESAPAP